MKRALMVFGVVALTVSLFSSIAFASGNPMVAGTFTFADQGQGGWTGGPLFSDGTAGGGGTLSFANGQVVSMLRPTTWSWDGQDVVNICFTITDLKGTSGFAGSYCEDVPVTGTPVVVPDPDSGGLATVRVTLTH